MKNRKYLVFFLAIFLCGLSTGPTFAQTLLEIRQCDASLLLTRDFQGKHRDLMVSLQITYFLQDGNEITGELDFGKTVLKNASVFDIDNAPIQSVVIEKYPRFKRNRLTWRFPAAPGEETTITVKFSLNDIIRGDMEENWLELVWLTKWDCPVYNMSYHLIIPFNQNFKVVDTTPVPGKVAKHVSGRVIEMFEDEVSGEPYRVAFSPGIAPELIRPDEEESGSFFGSIFFYIIIIVIIGIVFGLDMTPFGRSSRAGSSRK